MGHIKPGIDEIFLAALEQTTGERSVYLDLACAGDLELRERVERLLNAQPKVASFLECPAPGVPTARPAELASFEQPGQAIGPYKLLEQIGEGGFGVVFMAEQTTPVRRKVALKIIKPGMDTRQVIARFEAERQALALMDHPSIARVFDAGTTDSGRPYFVMELVHGVPITEYCNLQKLTPPERLRLFVDVCRAVEHAHQKGIIHRDLKSLNVLVTMYDDKPVPKIIDFGVSKAIGQQLTQKTLFTAFGQMVGTPIYMSPEQAQLSGLDVDTRSDVYSLGVVLYELLTGATPFDEATLKRVGFDEMRRMIREEEPLRPSARVSTHQGDLLATVADQRKIDPRKLSQSLRGDLDWIVTRALEKDRNRRYESANSLARDIEHYLNGEPVLARPPSRAYLLRKLVQRNRGPVLSACLVLLALVAGIIGTTWGMIRAEQARKAAVSAQRAEAQQARGERRAKEEAQKRLAQIEMATDTLASMIGDVDPLAADREGVTTRALLGRRLAEAAEQLDGEAIGDPLVVARLQHVLGISLYELGHLKQAEIALVRARRTRERLLGAANLDTVATKHHLAMLSWAQAKYDLAERLYKESLEVRTARLGPDHPDTLESQHYLAILYHSHRNHELAERLLNEVIERRTATLGVDHPDTLASQHRLALLYRSQAKFDLAEALCQEVLALRTTTLGSDHLDTLASKHLLAALYRILGNSADAETLYKEVLQIRTAKLGADHPDTLTSRHHLALLYAGSTPTLDLAVPLLDETLKLRKAKLGPDHPVTLRTQLDLATIYRDAERIADAIPLLEEVHQKGQNDRLLVRAGSVLLDAYLRAGKMTEATALATALLPAARREFPADSLEHYGALADAGWALMDAEAYAEAEPLLQETLSRGERHFSDSWRTQHTRLLLGVALLGQHRFAEAEPLLLSSYDALRKRDTLGSMGFALHKLVELYDAWGKPAQAAEWRKRLSERTAGSESGDF